MMAISIILFLAAFVWYLNIRGIFSRVNEAAAEKAKGITK
jgi:hypothetical protein